jgi:hypothetical protein
MRSSSVLRAGVALALLAYAIVELLRSLALAASPELYPFLVHTVLAFLAGWAGIALWMRSRWAPVALVTLGTVFAATRLLDAFVLGIRPWLFALLSASTAILAALLLARWARAESQPSEPPSSRTSAGRPR